MKTYLDPNVLPKKKNKLYDGACKDGFYLGLKSETQLAFLFQKHV